MMRREVKNVKAVRKIAAVSLMAAGLCLAVPGAARAENGAWKQLQSESGPYWTYVDSSGLPFYSQKAEIDGKLYFFDENGHMLTGWVSEDGEPIDDSSGEGYKDGLYYCGGPDEGWAVTGWKYIEIFREDGGTGRKWFYFKENGKKASDTRITEEDENGRYHYYLDEDGILKSSKKVSGSEKTVKNRDGEVLSGVWFQKVPGKGQDLYAYENNIPRWYYGVSGDRIAKDGIKNIDGKKYLFDSVGIMRSGLVAVKDGKYVQTLISEADDKDCSKEELQELYGSCKIMYFDEKNGDRKTGTQKLLISGEEETFMFDSQGAAVHGEYEGKLYDSGILQTADSDLKYEIVTVDDREYLIDTSGKVKKNGTYEDEDGTVWSVERQGGRYVITEK